MGINHTGPRLDDGTSISELESDNVLACSENQSFRLDGQELRPGAGTSTVPPRCYQANCLLAQA
eukprot:1139236-Pelagomonas_calceolata.AAC.4